MNRVNNFSLCDFFIILSEDCFIIAKVIITIVLISIQ